MALNLETLREIFEISKNIASAADLDPLIRRIGSAAVRLLEAEASSVMLLDDDRQNLVFKVPTIESGGVEQRMTLKVGVGLAGICAQENTALIVNDVTKDNRFTGFLDKLTGFTTQSSICVPLTVNEKELIGVIEVLNKKSGKFSETDLEVLGDIASLASTSIHSLRTTTDYKNFFVNILEVLVTAIESHSKMLIGHSWSVVQLSTVLAKLYGLKDKEYRDIYYGALLHDIGFVQIRSDLNVDGGVVTTKERNPETVHPKIGSELVKNINLLKGASSIIRHHHENYDGTGFPDGLAGEKIPIGARIVALVEAVAEMRMRGMDTEKIKQMIKSGQETRFDPEIVGIFLKEYSARPLE
jgi:HD-GYP domain-containing protein (c-di-GMP phosphodiesterase class II)